MADTSRSSTPKTAPAEVGSAARDPARVVGRYILVQRVGSGGMGDVWRAWEPELARWVALKFLKDDDPEEVLRFEREAQTAASLHHPNIAAVYEVGQVDTAMGRRHYIAMELVDGTTLAKMPRTDRRRLVELVREAAFAVQYAHDQGIVHRDLKPPNLMVSSAGRVYVMDFGLARQMRAGSSLTVSGMMIGTPSYMSPEQARGDVRLVDARSDVYGLGASLYDLLAGQPPFNQPNVIDIAVSVVNEEAKPLRKLDPSIDPDLETIVMKCLEKEPSRRYGTARDFAEDLGRWLDGDAVQAKPVSTWRRVVKKVRRNKAVTAVGSILVVVIIAAITALLAQGSQAARRTDALQRLGTQWALILERKREWRTLSTSAKAAKRELEQAVRDVDAHIAAWPADPQGYYVRARGRYCLSDLAGARRDVDDALRLRSDFKPGWTLLGMILLEEYQDHLYEGGAETLKQRVAEFRAMLDEAQAAFSKGWVSGQEQDEARRWGLTWTREDEVMERLARAIRLYYVESRNDDAHQLLAEGLERFKAEEYVRLAGIIFGAKPGTISLYDSALARVPGYDRLWLDRAIIRQELGDTAGAIADYTAALNLKPDFAMAWNNRGTARKAEGDVDGAIEDFTKAVEADPRFAIGYLNRGILRHDRGDVTGSMADLNKAVELRPRWAEAICTRGVVRTDSDREKAVADFDAALAIDPKYADAYLNRGCAKLAGGDPVGALADFNAALDANPKHALALCYRGAERIARGDRGGMEDLDRAVELARDDVRPHFRRGLARRSLGDAEGAVDDFTRVIERKPRDAEGWFNRAVAKRQAGDVPGALADYDEALTIKPEHMQARYNRGQLRRLAGDVDGAIADFDGAIELGCQEPSAWFQRGMGKASKRDIPGALADFDEAIRRKPDFSEALANRGRLREREGNLKGAIADYEAALEHAPVTWTVRPRVQEWLEAARKKLEE